MSLFRYTVCVNDYYFAILENLEKLDEICAVFRIFSNWTFPHKFTSGELSQTIFNRALLANI